MNIDVTKNVHVRFRIMQWKIYAKLLANPTNSKGRRTCSVTRLYLGYKLRHICWNSLNEHTSTFCHFTTLKGGKSRVAKYSAVVMLIFNVFQLNVMGVV